MDLKSGFQHYIICRILIQNSARAYILASHMSRSLTVTPQIMPIFNTGQLGDVHSLSVSMANSRHALHIICTAPFVWRSEHYNKDPYLTVIQKTDLLPSTMRIYDKDPRYGSTAKYDKDLLPSTTRIYYQARQGSTIKYEMDVLRRIYYLRLCFQARCWSVESALLQLSHIGHMRKSLGEG